MLEQPNEPQFYPNEQKIIFNNENNNTLQSIDGTLKRIEQMIIQLQNLFFVLDGHSALEQRLKENSID